MIPIFNHTFYLISYLISLSMAPIRRSNRVPKPRDYWDPTISPPRRRQAPAFTIYTDPSEDLFYAPIPPKTYAPIPPRTYTVSFPKAQAPSAPRGYAASPAK